MYLLLAMLLQIGPNKTCEVRFTELPPVIDGVIENVWMNADSAYDFIQYQPYEKAKPSDNTVVYVLQDANSLYIAFRCWTKNTKPINQMSDNDDGVTVYLDAFMSKTVAYSFTVTVSGIYSDGLLLDDGKTRDNSWDGVWSYGVKVYDDRYEVEIKIPFKSIRYKKGLSEWGINFKRYIPSKHETDFWTEVLQKEGNLVSKYGTLKGINPRAVGYYFELYPESFVRSNKVGENQTEIKASGSLNFKWDITSQTTLNATTFPDFAQIESDPFTLNLTRYETYLSERRPFFIEGSEIFKMADFGKGGGFYSPLNIFYSRRIGKSINNEVVPIIGGIKLTSKSGKLNYGLLGAYTDELKNGATLIESRRGFGVFRGKYSVLENSDVGALFSGTVVNTDTYNYAIGLDCAYRSGANQLIVQGACADRNNKMGLGFSSGFTGVIKTFSTIACAEIVQNSFDVRDIGYVPWAGMKRFLLLAGPYKIYPTGFLRDLWTYFGGIVLREPDNANWSKTVYLSFNPNFRNNWGVYLAFKFGPFYEANTHYLQRWGNFSIWGNGAKYNFWMGSNVSYNYNYSRRFLAYQANPYYGFIWRLIPRVSFELASHSWIEWDTTNTIIALWPMATPRINFTITPTMRIGIFNEFVFNTPGTDFGATEYLTNRFGFLFSYNFRPKSWLYIALNDYRVHDVTDKLVLQSQVGAIKAKYLIYF